MFDSTLSLFVPRRHSCVYSRGLPEPAEHVARRQSAQTAGKREGQRKIQGVGLV